MKIMELKRVKLLKEDSFEKNYEINCIFYRLSNIKLAIFIFLCIITVGIAYLASRVTNFS